MEGRFNMAASIDYGLFSATPAIWLTHGSRRQGSDR